MRHLLHKAILAAIEAGKQIVEVYNTPFAVEIKNDNTPVTLADKTASDCIIQLLSDTNIPVLSEEGEHTDYAIRQHWQQLWIVDPLDGTKEFVKRNGEFTVNIALVDNQHPVLGVIYSPIYHDLYFALKELGAYKIDRHTMMAILDDIHHYDLEQLLQKGERLPLAFKPSVYTIVASRSHLSSEIAQHIETRKRTHTHIDVINTGSSIKMCWVAEGKAHEYPRFGTTMEWDTAAGQAILEQAGGELIDAKTQQSLHYNKENLVNSWFIAKRKD